MLAIEFEGMRFTTLDALVNFVCLRYGGLWAVPDDHPNLAIVESLIALNDGWYRDVNGIAAMRYVYEDSR